MKKMRGVITPISTPMNEDQSVDFHSLKRLCDFLIEKGVYGLFPNGSTGEMLFLSIEERKKVLECCVEAARGRVPVFSMVGAAATRDTIDLARHALDCGAAGVGVVTPYYYKLDEEDLMEHYIAVSRSLPEDYPIYMYGIPQYAVNDISPRLALQVMRRAPNVVGLKYSYPDMGRIMDFCDMENGRASVLVGLDELFYPALCMGADGTISGNSNVVPERIVGIYKAFAEGNHRGAKELQQRTNRITSAFCGKNLMAVYKCLLKHRGVISCDQLRAPLRRLNPAEAEKLIRFVEEADYTGC